MPASDLLNRSQVVTRALQATQQPLTVGCEECVCHVSAGSGHIRQPALADRFRKPIRSAGVSTVRITGSVFSSPQTVAELQRIVGATENRLAVAPPAVGGNVSAQMTSSLRELEQRTRRRRLPTCARIRQKTLAKTGLLHALKGKITSGACDFSVELLTGIRPIRRRRRAGLTGLVITSAVHCNTTDAILGSTECNAVHEEHEGALQKSRRTTHPHRLQRRWIQTSQ
jgi:hypothetical protein